MDFFPEPKTDVSQTILSIDHPNTIASIDELIEQYLNLKPRVETCYQESTQKQDPEVIISENTTTQLNSSQQEDRKSLRNKKSVFHNFQKHVITFLKRHVWIKARTFEGESFSKTAYELWQIFIKSGSGNKKIMHIIFGLPDTNQLEEEIAALAEEVKEFKQIIKKRGLSVVLQAQRLLRQEVSQQTSHLTREELQPKCHVSNFDLFHEYLACFLDEISSGPLTKRVNKKQKHSMVAKISTVREN